MPDKPPFGGGRQSGKSRPMRKIVLVQLAFIVIGGLLWASMPQETIPSFAWRFHFGGGLFCFGAVFGYGIGYVSKTDAG